MYARGTRAWGVCDRCGFRYLLSTLRGETVMGRSKNNRVCESCFDGDHPQNWLGRQRVVDPQALRNPRPEIAETAVAAYEPEYVGPGNEP